jgi:predicted O-methyltransferase YrrM
MIRVVPLIFKIYANAHFAQSIAQNLFPISISLRQGMYLVSLINRYKPFLLLELGVGYGISSLWIQAAKHTPKKHIAVDPYGPKPNNPIITQTLSQQPNLHFHQNISSQHYTANLNQKGKQVDFVFIDADEKFDSVVTDMYFVTKVLKKNGIVVIRNIWNPSVRKAMLFFIKNLPYQIEGITTHEQKIIRHVPFIGELLLRIKCRPLDFLVLKLTKKDHREWNHFVPF